MSGSVSSASPPLTTTKHPEMTFVNVEKSSLPEGETGVLESALAKQIEGLVPCMPTVRIATPLNAIPDELTHLTPAGRNGSNLRPSTGVQYVPLSSGWPVSWEARQSASSLGHLAESRQPTSGCRAQLVGPARRRNVRDRA